MSDPRFHIRREAWRDNVALFFALQMDDGTMAHARPAELWIKPPDGHIGTAGHVAATQAHLADFRALVSKTLDVKLP